MLIGILSEYHYYFNSSIYSWVSLFYFLYWYGLLSLFLLQKFNFVLFYYIFFPLFAHLSQEMCKRCFHQFLLLLLIILHFFIGKLSKSKNSLISIIFCTHKVLGSAYFQCKIWLCKFDISEGFILITYANKFSVYGLSGMLR